MVAVSNGNVVAGNMGVSNTSGTTSFSGGNITVGNLTKTGAGDFLISNTLSVIGTFQNSGNGSVGLSGGLTDGSIVQSGSGTLSLSATNSYTGSTLVTNGTLNVLGVITQTSSVTADGAAATIAVDGTMTTPGGLTIGGTGTGILTVQNGGVVNAGTMTLANSLGSFGTLNIGSGAGLLTAETVTGGSGTAIINFNQGGSSYSFFSQLAGNIAVNQLCSGTTSLTGTNSYTGVTTLAAGTLSFANGSLGTSLVDFTGASTLQWHDTNTQDVSDRLKIEDAITATIDTNGNNVTFGSTLQTGPSHTGALIKTGAGTLILAGVNNYSGMTTIITGQVNLANQNALGQSTISINGGGLTFDSTVGGHAFTVGGLEAGASGLGVVLEDNAGSPNAVALSVGNNSANTTYDGVMSGSGSLIKIGTGKLTLTGSNSYTGGTTLNGGILNLGSNEALGTTGTISFGGGTMQYTPAVLVDLSSRFSSADNQIYKVDLNGCNAVWASTLTSAGGSLIKAGAGTLTLSGSNSYTNGTTLSAGRLNVNNSNGLGTGAVTIYGSNADNLGTLQYAPSNSILYVGALNLNGFAEIELQSNSSLHSSWDVTINGSGNLINLSGTTWNSGTNILLYGTSTAFGPSAEISLTGSMFNGQTLALGGSTTIGRNAFTFGSNSNSFYFQLTNLHFDLVWTGSANNQWNTTGTNWQSSTSGASPSGPNIAFATADNVYFSGTGAVITVDSGGIQAGAMWVSNPSGTVSFSGGNFSAANLTKTGAGDLLISDTLSVSGTLQNSGNGAVTLSGGLADGSLVQSGSGTLSLSATNRYNGSTSVTSGTLNVFGVITQTASVTVDGTAATMAVDGASSSLITPGAMLVGGTGTGILTLQNGGVVNALTVTLANGLGSFGTLNIGNGAGLFTTGTVTGGNGTAIINFNQGGSSYMFGSQITGNIMVNQLCSGTTSLTNVNSYTGLTTLALGTLSFANGSLGTSLIDFTGNSTLQWHDSNTQDVSAQLKIEDGMTATLDTQGNNVTLGSALQTGTAQTGALMKIGVGKLTLSGSNSYTGGTTLSGGSLSLGSIGALGLTGTITFGDGTLQYTSSNRTDYSNRFSTAASQQYKVDTNGQDVTWASALTSAGGSLNKIGAGILTLTASNSYSGGTAVINGGGLCLWDDSQLGAIPGTLSINVIL